MMNIARISFCIFVVWLISSTTYGQDYTGYKNKSVDLVSSNLPIIIMETGGQDIPGNSKIEIQMGIINNFGADNHISDPFNDYNGIIGIETRGSSSAGWPKKSYSLETRNADGTNRNVKLLGMPQENDWVLNGPFSDKSLMRNVLAYKLGRGTGRWSPRTHFCELIIDDEYLGVYVLMEKIKRDRNRLDIATLNPDEITGDDLTGGYIIKIDRPDEYWTSDYPSPVGNHPVYFSYVYPDPDEMPVEQKNYIHAFVDDFEDALAGDNFVNPDLGYRKYANPESFMDFFLINELSRNVDAYRLSTYFHKNRATRGGKLIMGPLWDFNLSFGNADYYEAFKSDGWMVHTVAANDNYQPPFWWDRLREDPYFNSALKSRWESLRENVLSLDQIEDIIDSVALLLDDAQARNFGTFPILGTYVWPNYYIANSYEDEIQFMKDWIADRISWMDVQLASIPEFHSENIAVNSYEISLFPNPFIEEITVRYYVLKNCVFSIRVIDVMGRELLMLNRTVQPGYNELSLPLCGVTSQSGMYMVQFSVNGKMVKTEKILRE